MAIRNKKEKSKVIFLLPSLRGGGAEKIILNVIKNIDRKEFDPILAIIENECDYSIPKNTKVRRLDCKRARHSIFKLRKLIKKERPDIVLSSVIQSAIALYLAKKILITQKPKTIHRVANYFSKIDAPFLTKSIYKTALKNFDNIIAVSKALKMNLVKDAGLSSDKIRTIYNPIDLEKIKKETRGSIDEKFMTNKNTKIILGCGSLSKQKGFSYLIRAAQEIIQKNDNVYLVILGKGKKEKELRKLAEKLNIKTKVKLLGFKSNPYKYMHQADVFVLSSLWEGLPGVLIEAMSTGSAVVSTNCKSGPREILKNGKYGALIPPKNTAKMAKEIKKILFDKKRKRKMEKIAEKRAKDFRLKKQVKKYEAFLKSNINQ